MNLFGLTALSVARRWRRNLMTVGAVVIGAASVTAVLAINQSSAQSLANAVNELQSTVVLATLPSDAWAKSEESLTLSATSISGVVSAGTLSLPAAGTYNVEVSRSAGGTVVRASTAVGTAGGLAARHASVIRGGISTTQVVEMDPDQVLVGAALARQLGVDAEPGLNELWLNGSQVTVTGILVDGDSNSVLSSVVFLSPGAARHLGLLPQGRLFVMRVQPGAAEQVASAAPVAMDPEAASDVSVSYSPSAAQLREKLLDGSRVLVLVIGSVTVGATLFGIVTTMQIAVWERRQELGIARALGSSRRQIGLRFLIESAILGFAGATIGSGVGILIGAGVSLASGWTFILPPVVVGFPLFGIAVGALAGAAPAWLATRVEPAELLRSA